MPKIRLPVKPINPGTKLITHPPTAGAFQVIGQTRYVSGGWNADQQVGMVRLYTYLNHLGFPPLCYIHKRRSQFSFDLGRDGLVPIFRHKNKVQPNRVNGVGT